MAAVSALAQSSGPPLPPVGFNPVIAPPAGTVVQSEIITLPATACAQMQAAATGCQVLHRSWGTNHQALPSGTQVASRPLFSDHVALASVPPGYWYWSWWDQECSGVWPYCSFPGWSLTMTEDGIANGTSIWEWNHGCTPGGLDSSVTWCGYLYNGGANVGNGCCEMQYGLNGQICVIAQTGTFCYQHGMRRWMWADGKPGSYSQW
jgi:hypothetical protein